jgi:hypothetical protein
MPSEIKLINEDDFGNCRGVTVTLALKAVEAVNQSLKRGRARCRLCDAPISWHSELLVLSQFMVTTRTMIMNFLCHECAKPINDACREGSQNGEKKKADRERAEAAPLGSGPAGQVPCPAGGLREV